MTQEMMRSFEELRRVLYSAVVCDALDGLGFPNQSPRLPFPIRTAEGVLFGRCRTTLWEEVSEEDSNPYEKELIALDLCQPDEVLICAAAGSMRSGIWGELLSTAAMNRGCVGAIVDGAVRDVAQMHAMGFHVIARGTCVCDSKNRQRVSEYNVTVEIGGVPIHNGDIIIGDCDGLVVIPQKVERAVLSAAWKKVHDENRTRDAIRGGMGAQEAYDRFGVL
ncbi:RraA family protein [Verrucomicrobia bacterium]|jgi:4-hydroxy-4-methyl-2-oxoglutarate aldolase|nr:RraA family protein [Verrucomicrobiota bacterium]MDB4745788.1 RraA family protein [Verrucomicrobiota bacterium]